MRNLKKFLIVCTFFVALALLAGCASAPAPEIAATEAPTATPSPTATPAPISFEAAAEANRAELRTFSDYGSVFSAVQESKAEGDGADVPAHSSALRAAASPDELTESDILRVDGEYIYTLTDKNLTIFHLSGEAGELISTTPVGTAWSSSGDGSGNFAGSERTPLALFLRGSRLAVLLDVYGYDSFGGEMRYSEYVGVDSDAWMSGGALCVATDFSVLDAADAADTDKFIPRVHTAADSRQLEAESLYALPNSGEGCTVLGGYSLDEAAQKNAVAVYGIEAKNVYAESRRMSDSMGDYTEYVELLCTDLFRFDYDASGIRPAASGVVNGLLPERSAIAPFGSGYVCL